MTKQVVNKQQCDKVPSIVICIYTLTAKSLTTVNNVSILYNIIKHIFFQLNFYKKGLFSVALVLKAHLIVLDCIGCK